ncbi:hypothetical protein L2744_07690 [Shewanella profunda]|uniref:hypothetical protein n=1 Tax=Shewanella profunda TaxID=254793 RepID=UPI00200D2459|nr:hypothetical protein [Shewanella profunda]MCL1089488.1 hypothetical protein [Shewanella profunda]
MNSILNSLNLNRSSASVIDAYGVNSQKASTTKTDTSTETTQTQASATKTDPASSDDIALSPRALRAQKIQAMSKDFFADGKFSVADIPALVSRLQQDGILSDSQLERLSQNGITVPSTSTSTPSKQSLQDFLDDELKTLAKNSPDSPLINTLVDAKSVLSNMDDAQSPVLAQKAAKVFGQLTEYLNSEPPMTDKQKQQWQGLKSTMQVASSLGAQQSASGQLSSYLALAKR